jgi:hypothetical protein
MLDKLPKGLLDTLRSNALTSNELMGKIDAPRGPRIGFTPAERAEMASKMSEFTGNIEIDPRGLPDDFYLNKAITEFTQPQADELRRRINQREDFAKRYYSY